MQNQSVTLDAVVPVFGRKAVLQLSPDQKMFCFLAFMVALWTLLCALSHQSPDVDGMEQLVWSASLELGYYKHPPFPSWIMYVLTQLFGRPYWLSFFAGMLASTTGLWFVWLLGKEITTIRNAFIATALVSTTIYFSSRGTIFNHNTAQFWSITASTWLLYRALRYQKISTWFWLGLVSALAVMTKYSIVIQWTGFFLFMLRQRCYGQVQTWKGLAMATLSFTIFVSPHFFWLFDNQFLPLGYANDSIEATSHLQSLVLIVHFVLDQLARLSPMLVIWLAWFWWTRRATNLRTAINIPAARPFHAGDLETPATGQERPVRYYHHFDAWDRSFILWVGLTPVIATTLASAMLGTRLIASWATTFFVLYGFFVLWWLHGPPRTVFRRIIILVIGVHILMAVGYALGRGPLAWHSARDSRSVFPSAQVSMLMQRVWFDHVADHPLRLVAASTWLGGSVAIHADRNTQVFSNGRFMESPWLAPDGALDCGMLVVYTSLWGGPTLELLKLHAQATWQGETSLHWSNEKSTLINLHWGVIPPGPNCRQAEAEVRAQGL
jgi:hypothetical protein